MNSRFTGRASCLLGGLLLATAVSAQQYPQRPLRYIVPFPPGGITDLSARVIGPRLADALGQPIVIENRVGGGGNIGAEVVAKAQPDGYTLLSAAPPVAISQSLYKNLSFSPRKDLAPVALLGSVPNVLVVSAKSPANSLKELLELARRNPGKLNYASVGAGTSVHLAAELLKYHAKVNIVHVPYKGAPAAMTAVVAGDVDLMMDALPPSLPHIKGGRMRALAVTTAQRVPQLPDVPTLIEQGFPNFEVSSWVGISTTAGTPAEIVGRLEAEVKKAAANPDVIAALERIGMAVKFMPAKEFGAFIDAEIDKFSVAVKFSGAIAD
jgi:tripartite-type tricarboxylate transporter receptor subunit TctC